MEEKQPIRRQIETAFTHLLESMYSLIETGLRKRYHEEWWRKGVLLSGINEIHTANLPASGGSEELLMSLDEQKALLIISKRYSELGLQRDASNFAMRLNQDRNKICHLGVRDLTKDDAWAILYDMISFCEHFDKQLASEIRTMRDELCPVMVHKQVIPIEQIQKTEASEDILPMDVIDNQTRILRDDLKKTVVNRSKVSISAPLFSVFAFQELKNELESIDEFRFLFTSQTFTVDDGVKKKVAREYFIPKLDREKGVCGTEFEIKLRNEMTLKAISKECAEWIKSRATFKSNSTLQVIPGMLNIKSNINMTYSPFNEFTTVGIGCDRGNYLLNPTTRLSGPMCETFHRQFDQVWNSPDMVEDVTSSVIRSLMTVYDENPPELIYYMSLYNIFREFLDDVSEDVLPNEQTGFKNTKIWNKLYQFQKDAAIAVINKLEKYNGCILADSVGLGKTYTALAVIKYYELRNKSVLVLCPKKLGDNWNTFCSRYRNNPLAEDRLNYMVLYHTDLLRKRGLSNGYDLSKISWENFDLVVIDESHNFRNGSDSVGTGQRDNRYTRLMRDIVQKGVRTKVLMLSATPVNNRFNDLKNQLALAYEGNPDNLDSKLDTSSSIDMIFREAQGVYNKWAKLPAIQRTTETLLDELSFDFFKVLDSVTIARSRKHIMRYYGTGDVGTFPVRRKPLSKRCGMTALKGMPNYDDIFAELTKLNLDLYTPVKYVHPSKLSNYDKQVDSSNINMRGREEGIRAIMRITLLKRLESSVHSFRLTLERVLGNMDSTLSAIGVFESKKKSGYSGKLMVDSTSINDEDLDLDDQNIDFTVGKMEIDLSDMDYISWRNAILNDREVLNGLINTIRKITPEYDEKLDFLKRTISAKVEDPINPENRKLLIFTAFADTADYLYEHISKYVRVKYSLETALITGSTEGKTTIKGLKADMNQVLSCFSPVSKERDLLYEENERRDIDILIATDCISEGQNLQDCDCVINYDIHWNPVRIIQRFGRVDRIGSVNKEIQLINFWPDMSLDDYINLKDRVESRMKISVATSTGDDDPINFDERGDLEYRKKQLEHLKDENVDLEDVSGGVSIMDLGLNEFRMDLVEYMRENSKVETCPHGINAVVSANGDTPGGAIFVLRNVNEGVNIESRNRLHPFYLVYVGSGGKIVLDHLKPKALLDIMRFLCKGKSDPDDDACVAFNKETDDGRMMKEYSEMLKDAVKSIITVNEESELDSLFSPGGTTALNTNISGIDDFELICFLAVK